MMIRRGEINKNGGFGIRKGKGLRLSRRLTFRRALKVMQSTSRRRSAPLSPKISTSNSTKRWEIKFSQIFAAFALS